MTYPRIAFFPIVRVQFDVALAEQLIGTARKNLQQAGFELLGPEKAVNDLASTQAALAQFKTEKVDLVLIFQATFADSSMVAAIAEELDAPLFLWAMPEEWSGGRLRLNSLCGINLAGHGTRQSVQQPFTIGYLARVCPEKGLHHLAAARRISGPSFMISRPSLRANTIASSATRFACAPA